MTGETKHVYAINAKTPSSKENDTALKQFSKKDATSDPSRVSDNSESALIADKASQLNGRERETCSQREAVIRPQQAGKIDFKSFQNRPKYSSDAAWTNSKSSPLSPTGKSRGKDKNKRSGKGDRSQHQLYRLSLNSARSNPTIGIAYPQQKVTPPKKVEVSHGPVSGSYRFHVPSLPEREAELHQEDLNFSRSLSDPSPSLTSTNYTSQTAPANRTHHSLKLQQGNLHDKSNTNGQLHYLEFQPNSNKWHPSEKLFSGTSGYPVPNQKLCPYPEGNKSDSHGFGPLSFQYPFQPLQEPTGNTFCNNGNSQDFVDASLAASQVAHNSFSFQSSSREGLEDPQGNGSYNTVLPDSRTYGLPSQQSPFLHTQQGVQHPPTPPCYTGRLEHSAEHNGAISSSGALTSSGAIEQTQSTFQEKQTVFNPSEFSLHNTNTPALISKRQQPAKDFVHSQRLLTPGNTLRRNIPQTSLNKVHFPNKPYNNVNTGSVPFEKNLSRIPQTWDTGSNSFPPLDQNSLSYPNASGNSLPYQCQPSDPKQALKNPRMPWQQVHLTSPTANQNHIELSRHNGNHKLPYNLGNSDWQNNTMMPKILPSYAKKHIVVDGSSTQRSETSRQSYSSSNDILYDSVKDTNSQISDSRTKGVLYGMSQPIPQPRNNFNHSNQSVPLSGKTFVAESPCESPLPSPVTNPVTGSTCSSLSPMSSSPVNPSSEESQVPPTLTSSPYFHQPCHQTDKSFHPNDPLNSGSFLYHKAEHIKNFTFLLDSSKDEQTFKNLQENQYQKLANEPSKGCLESFESEPPPPYSSHHFLASSLSSANLDQLDILLTCKQCDQNFGNLSSFLEHRQYCNLNSTLQNEIKDTLHGGDVRKSAAPQTILGLSHHKGQIEFHTQLAGFHKDYLDCDAKGEPKDDPLKSSTFHNGAAHLLPMTVCETLEMDDAKLDSLIIEALNGLEFQVDNPEIDSTFIDVFVDDELTSSKPTVCNQPHKVKETTDTRKNAIVEEKHTDYNRDSYTCDESFEKEASYNHGTSIKMRNVSKSAEVGTAHPYSMDNETTSIKHVAAIRSEDSDQQTRGDTKTFFTSQEKKKMNLNKNNFDTTEDKVLKSFDFKQGKNDPKDFSIADTPKSRRTTLRDVKKKKSHNGTWSKELIHKIVQQKNKLHKLHVKSNKNVQFSLVTERIFPPTKNHPFGEYDYISDSDEDVAANLLPSKMQPNGRLKYSFNRDLQGRNGRQKLKEPVWRMGEATRFQLQSKDLRCTNKDTSTRIRRRSSQSSNSSDQSTSMSSEAGSSPKSTERTDSENEQEMALRCKTFNARGQNTTLERNPIKPLYRENTSDNQVHSTDFSKGTKRFGSAKFLLASSKVYPSTMNPETHYQEKGTLQQCVDSIGQNSSKKMEAHNFEEGQPKLSTYQDTIAASTLSQNNYTSDLILAINNVSQELSTFNSDNTDYQKKQLNSSTSIPEMLNPGGNPTCSDNNVKNLREELCYSHKDFALPISCFSGDSTINILPQQNQKDFGNECQQFTENKHEDLPDLYNNNIFAKTQMPPTIDIEQIYSSQSNDNNINFEQKCPDIPSYPPDKVSSTFSFDSPSIFAGLPISDFESTMYNSMTPPKDNYMEFNQPSKSTPFEHPFTQYLPEKSWDLIEEDAPLLSANITAFQGNDNQAAEKYTEHVPVPSEQMSEDLSRNITDYSASYISNVQAEDELEIKRLVTELENHLQTSKAHKEVSSQTLAKHHITPELRDSSLPYSEIEVNQTENSRNDSYLNENHNNPSNVNSLGPPTKVDCNILDSQPLVKGNTPENLKSPWDCSVQFETFSSTIECHKQTRTLTSFTSQEESNQYQSAARDVCLTEEIKSLNHGTPSVISGVYLHNLSNQMECQSFSDHELLRDTLITTEIMLSDSQENDIPKKERQENDNEMPINKLQKLDEQFDDPPELEHFQSISETNSEFGLKDDSAPDLNMTVMPDHNDSKTEANLCEPVIKLLIPQTSKNTEHGDDHLKLGDKKASDKHGYKDKKQSVLLDMPVLVKEENTISEKPTSTQEATQNPLQQLQLFVARTAKNNEEEMLMPCFPVILAASIAAENKSEAERDASYILESAETFTAESENNPKMTEIKGATQLTESSIHTSQNDEDNMFGHKDSISGKLAEPLMNKVPCEDTQIKHLENECPSLNVINIGEEGARNLQPLDSRDAASLQQQQVKDNEEICHYGGNDGKRLYPFVMKTKKADRSNHTCDKEKYTSDSIFTPKVLSVPETSCDRPDVRCLAPGSVDTEVVQLSKDKCNQDLNKEITDFVCPSNHMQDINMLAETELFLVDNKTQEHSSTLSKSSCRISDIADKSSHFTLQPNISDVQQNSSNEYEAQLHDLGLPSEQSLLNFDLLTVEPIKDPIAQQKLLYTSQKELSSNEKDTLGSVNQAFLNVTTSPLEQIPEKSSVGVTDMQLFLSEERIITSSTEISQKQMTAKDTITVTPVVEDGLSPCFCSELVCPHFKHQQVQSVADIILGCQSMATDDTYSPIYAGENHQNFSALHDELFSESMQNSVAPLLCNRKEELPKNDWNKPQDIPDIVHAYQNENKSSTAMVCDLMNIAAPEYVHFTCHQATEGISVPEQSSVSETQNSISNSESEKKGTNDMHSVINGVLRILEGDKSKEILQSIGITKKSSPIKEKKLSGLSLTCDICLVSFRSKPGLTRHKAVKHNSSLMSPKDATCDKTFGSINKIGEWKCNSESQQNLQTDTTSQHKMAEFLNQNKSFQLDEEPSKTKGEKSISGLPDNTSCIDISSKKKMNVKVKKRKAKHQNTTCTDSQVPPDDVLNILKTNILKAIGHSNTFSSTEDKTKWQEPSDKNMSRKQTELKEVKLKMCASICTDDDEKLVSDVLDMEMNREALIQEQTWADNIEGDVEHIINDCENQPLNNLLTNEQNSLNGTEEQLNTLEQANNKNDDHVSNVPKETVTDLHSLFDDDNSFSQLFPRDDHFIRRKCTRVYGKRRRRQTPPFETDFRQEEKGDHCHSSQIHYTCDYRTISGDSSSTVITNSSDQTEHLAQYNQPSPLEEGMNVDTKILSFVHQSKPENTNEQSLTESLPMEKDSRISRHKNLFKPPEESADFAAEIGSEIRESEVEQNLDCKANDESGLPEFPTIDMKMLSAKFDMRELSFFSACGDDSDQCDSDATDITHKAGKRKRHAKSKTDEKRQSKNRNKVKIKTKDKQYKCKVCFQWFLTLGELDFHKLTHNPSPPPTCYMCVQRKFSSREQLRDHLKDKHAKNKAGLWICGMCLKEISDVWMYNEHLREHATQFARKGQAQKSVMGIPGCFGEDSMVRTFLSTFIYRTPTKSSKNLETDEKSPVTKKQEPKEHKEEDEVVIEKESESSANVLPAAPKLSISSLLDSSQKSDTIHKNASMHPHCKDPSRDCHHCGKQFPKPFKLQRHLVVHSLQKIFLCHQCPKSYQEVQELRSHLTNEHQLTEKSEIKHTTLYACELCADVMHVIKKSFICSTCNYTFSKKEQYDRHMEKHLIGGSMTFKFRGVTRPTTSGKEVKENVKDSPDYARMPPSKKPKLSNYYDLSTDVPDASMPSQCPKLSPGVFFDKESGERSANEHENSVKIEEILLEAPELLAEGKEEPIAFSAELCCLTPVPCELNVPEKRDEELLRQTLPILNDDTAFSSSLCTAKTATFPKNNDLNCKVTETKEQTKQKGVVEMEEQPDSQTLQVKKDNNISNLMLQEPAELYAFKKLMPSPADTSKEQQCLLSEVTEEPKEDTQKLLSQDVAQPTMANTPKDKSLVTDTNALAKDLKFTKKNKSINQLNSLSPTQANVLASNGDNVLKSPTPKFKAACSQDSTLKETTSSQQKLSKKEATVILSKNNTDFKVADKMLASSMAPKLHPKKCREQKISVYKGNAGSQENLDGEIKKKRTKLAMTGKSESSAVAKKTDWVNSLSDAKDEVPCNRAYNKMNSGGVTGQFKKTVLDTHNQKKVNAASSNGENKSNKRALLSKGLHTFTPKSSPLSMNGHPYKRRLGASTKPTEPPNYRTAESQNNLLSQLFGQKITSFKIPLRRDITE